MAMFEVNSTRIDPYANFRFLVVFGRDVVAGASKVSGLKQTVEVVEHRDGGDMSTKRKSPGLTSFEPITIERGISHDRAFEEWAHLVYSPQGPGLVSLKDFRRDITIELYNLQGVKVRAWNAFRCWVSEFNAVPELDANANAIAFESVVLQNEGFDRDTSVLELPET
jgi:phage tail-like protein